MKIKVCAIVLLLCCVSAIPINKSFAADDLLASKQDPAGTFETRFVPYASPEMYGAVGDGITDDTEAWQRAVDSGKPVVAGSQLYRCGTITVTRDTDINCCNASFICMDTVLFSCSGTAGKGTWELDYKANSDYALSDRFTGIVYLVGNNNIFKQRDYYVGGSVEAFYKGVLNTQIPIDITSVAAYRLNTVQVNIRNISNVVFETEGKYKIIIKQTYCAFSIIENVNMTHECYSVVQFNQCFKCTYRDSHIDIPQYGEPGQSYYPIEILDTNYTNIENVYAHCVGWHCITTGNKTLCRGTKVTNCELYSDYANPAYADHQNGIETIITRSTLSSVGLGALGKLSDCDIVCCKDDDLCVVNLDMCSVDGIAHYVIENCRFYPQSNKRSGVRVVCAPRDTGKDADYFLNSLSVSNCRNMSSTADMPIKQVITSSVTGEITLRVLNVINTNLSVEMEADNTFIFGN